MFLYFRVDDCIFWIGLNVGLYKPEIILNYAWLYYEIANWQANEILCNSVTLACFVNKNIEVICIQTGVEYPFKCFYV